jgi:hypothetical protein
MRVPYAQADPEGTSCSNCGRVSTNNIEVRYPCQTFEKNTRTDEKSFNVTNHTFTEKRCWCSRTGVARGLPCFGMCMVWQLKNSSHLNVILSCLMRHRQKAKTRRQHSSVNAYTSCRWKGNSCCSFSARYAVMWWSCRSRAVLHVLPFLNRIPHRLLQPWCLRCPGTFSCASVVLQWTIILQSLVDRCQRSVVWQV